MTSCIECLAKLGTCMLSDDQQFVCIITTANRKMGNSETSHNKYTKY